ncbi:MAG: hypothetical protein NTW78_03835 [Campylobacterales bacterium]|nr:hypothetical protein [Campylobacterales bacterium]
MKTSDFILQTRSDLQEKSEHWKDEELLIKLQRAYIALQFDLPYFITSRVIAIKEGIDAYYLDLTPLKNMALRVENIHYNFVDIENFYSNVKNKTYTFSEDKLLIHPLPTKDCSATLVLKYQKELANSNCDIEIPTVYFKALRLLFLSEIHEKPTRNTKERVLSVHYIKLYDAEKNKLKTEQKMRAKNITSNYQRI